MTLTSLTHKKKSARNSSPLLDFRNPAAVYINTFNHWSSSILCSTSLGLERLKVHAFVYSKIALPFWWMKENISLSSISFITIVESFMIRARMVRAWTPPGAPFASDLTFKAFRLEVTFSTLVFSVGVKEGLKKISKPGTVW